MRARESDGLAGEAYLIVRERILRGELAIGQPISRRKLAAELGMSFLPVSEALLRLENEGLVESRPRAGTRVRLPSQEDVQGHYIVREALEVKSAMLFSEVATSSERSELMKLAARVDSLSTQTDSGRLIYLSLHEKLHWRVAECTRCKPLCDALARTSALASTWLCAAKVATPDDPPHTHQDLLKILSSDDSNAAGEAMRRHIQSSMQKTLRRLEPYFQMREQYADTFSRKPTKQLQIESLVASAASLEQSAEPRSER
ncbi:MAG: GntR family transcriptional regulator [Acidobacteriia bacterium]|nr:GntR family transcriptional regulator [Terriglobia bacterium]